MPITTIRPDGTNTAIYQELVDIYGGAASVHAALNDASDTTYVMCNTDKPIHPCAVLDMATTTIPEGSDIATVVPAFRTALGLTGQGHVCVGYRSGSTPIYGPWLSSTYYEVATSKVLAALSGAALAPGGSPWTQAAIDSLLAYVADTRVNNVKFYEVWANVYHYTRPTCTIAISGGSPVTATAFPKFAVTVSQVVDANEPWAFDTIQVKVFTDAVYEAGGFDPDTSIPEWFGSAVALAPLYSDGSTPTTRVQYLTPDTPMPGSDILRVYAKVKRNFTSASYGAWSYTQFVMNLDTTQPPTVSAIIDGQHVDVDVWYTPKGGHTLPTCRVERSSDSGVSWELVRGGEALDGDLGPPSPIIDYEAPRGVTLMYRANSETTYSGTRVTSPWGTDTATGTISTAAWNLKAPLDPTLNMLDIAVLKDPDYQQVEDVGVFRPKGRRYPVVVSGALGGADGSLTIRAGSSAEWAALTLLREHQYPLLLESPFGWARYIRLVNRGWQELGTAGSPRRVVTVAFLELEAP